MSVLAKQTFATELKERLYDKLTTKDIDTVITELIEQLSGFDMEQIATCSNSKEYEDMLNMYCNTLRMEGRSESTVARYKRELLRFHQYDSTPIRHVTVFNVRQYLAAEKERGLADSTLQGSRDIFHAYFGWLHREVYICKSFTLFYSAFDRTKITAWIGWDIEIEMLNSGCKDIKDKAILSFFLTTGCRVSEVVNINIKDVDFQNRCVKVCGKGDKERYVYFTPVTAMYLRKYLSTRNDELDALFVSKFRKRMSKSGFEAKLRDIGSKAGATNVFPHRFRHTFATNMIRNGMPIQEVAILMGHSNIDTTRVYAHTSQDRVKISYLKYA